MIDIVVVGGGHAGVEAALASSRLNNKTIMVVGNIQKIASMPCNPSIGGPAKGIIVREIDALGGEMGKAADATLIQIKMLNSAKGPAVRALRAQSDKVKYSEYMRDVVLRQPNLEVIEDLVYDILVEDGKVSAVLLASGKKIETKAVILACGTYMDSRVLVGHSFYPSGPDNEKTTNRLSQSLRGLGFELVRLKTGTPPRIKTTSIDFSSLAKQPGDDKELAFSEETTSFLPLEKQALCYLTYTTPKTHEIIRNNLDKSSMYGGIVEGVGPRYCPSIEDKVVRFKDKERHQIFLEPESVELNQTYIQGFSTSFPHEIQEMLVRSLPGLENAVFVKYAYAIEYDGINPMQLQKSLEAKSVKNLYFAGQINGTSGYEEAACQGLMAGINASLKLAGIEPLILGRDEAYIGVLIDDLVTKGVKDPYRMLTSRAEFRLLLRDDNASERLLKYGHDVGLISDERYQKFIEKRIDVEKLKNELETIILTPKQQINQYLQQLGKDIINDKINGKDFIKRPLIEIEDLEAIADYKFEYDAKIKQIALIEIKYAGYIEKAYKEAKKLKAMENKKIPENINYDDVPNIANEAKEKLKKVAPTTISQASRISGVNPADITMLLVYMEAYNNDKKTKE